MASVIRDGSSSFILVLIMFASAVKSHQPREEAAEHNLHLLNEELGIGGVEVIGERVIDENSHVHDYPATGGSTIDERPHNNIYDFDPEGTFTSLNYDSFAPQHPQVETSRTDRDHDFNMHRQQELNQQHFSGDTGNTGVSSHLSSGISIDDGLGVQSFVVRSADGQQLPRGYLLSIYPFAMNYLAPPPSFGELLTPPPLVTAPSSSTPTTTTSGEMTAALVANDFMMASNLETARSTGRSMTSSTNKKRRASRRRRRNIKKVKPSVIIVKKIIPLSTTTVR